MSLSKGTADKHQRQLFDLLTHTGNDVCADCKARAPRWASWNIGIFVCVSCASIHRKIGTHVSKVKSVTLDTWTRDQVDNMRKMGNLNANAIYNPDERRHPPPTNMEESERDSEMEKYIRGKYEYKRFMDRGPLPPAAEPEMKIVVPPSRAKTAPLPPLPSSGPTSTSTSTTKQAVFTPKLEYRPSISSSSSSSAPAYNPPPPTAPLSIAARPPPQQQAAPPPQPQPPKPTSPLWADMLSLSIGPTQQQQQQPPLQFLSPQNTLYASPNIPTTPSFQATSRSFSYPAAAPPNPFSQMNAGVQQQMTGYQGGVDVHGLGVSAFNTGGGGSQFMAQPQQPQFTAGGNFFNVSPSPFQQQQQQQFLQPQQTSFTPHSTPSPLPYQQQPSPLPYQQQPSPLPFQQQQPASAFQQQQYPSQSPPQEQPPNQSSFAQSMLPGAPQRAPSVSTNPFSGAWSGPQQQPQYQWGHNGT